MEGSGAPAPFLPMLHDAMEHPGMMSGETLNEIAGALRRPPPPTPPPKMRYPTPQHSPPQKGTPMPSQAEIRRLKRQVAESSHILDHQGLVDFHGHVSARIPGTGRMLIKPVLKAHNQVTARDIVEVDLEAYAAGSGSQWNPGLQRGRVIDAPVPPRETMLHVAIMLARPDVGSVVHTHQLIATSIGAGNVPIQPLYNQALPFAPETPIFPEPKLITTWDDGKAVADCLGDRTAALLRGHGVVVVGATVDHSVSNTIYLERAAIMQVVASIVGTPVPLAPEYVAEFGPDWERRASHAYEYFRSLVPSLRATGRRSQS